MTREQQARVDFEAKISNGRFKTAQVVLTGAYVKLTHTEMQDGKAVCFGKCGGQNFVWLEGQLENFCL